MQADDSLDFAGFYEIFWKNLVISSVFFCF